EEVPLKGSFTVRAMPAAGASAKAFARLAAAKQIESYDDGNTRSVTYLSPKLRSEIMSGTQSVNMQIAQVHSMSGDEGELVIGVPLITGDYSAGN
ncbi:YwmB family TATA-box binding protein, partial [Paenibacillus sepulcri]|nr:YwmB family TATA-box binding protein [Paenibacillus sepulcri]